MEINKPYTLPFIEFVGGSTQELVFYCYFLANKEPMDLASCTATFSVIDYVNKQSTPKLSKAMTIETNSELAEETDNIVRVTLDATDTVGFYGKYIYQITVQDSSGVVDIPNQGILHIINNIDKSLIG